MTTILVLNAVSSFLAIAGIGGLHAWQRRRNRRAVQPVYVSATTARRRLHR